MTTLTARLHQESRTWLSNPATIIIVAMMTGMTFSASGAAPTPLYHLYQERFGLTPARVTVIFAAYVLSLLLALLTTGALSDHIGRRPTVLGALMLNIIAMVMFITAGSGAALIAARTVQGFATGVATAALGGAIVDVDRSRGAVLNSVMVFAGLTIGTLSAATLVTFAPDPAQLVYLVLLALSGIEALLLCHMPETARTKSGALASLRPHVSVPIQARQTLAQLTPVTFASWALSGFYFSLMPALVRVATGATLPIVGGFVVAALTFSSVIAVLSLRNILANRVLLSAIPGLALGVAVTLGGVHAQSVALMLLGTMVSGLGFGAVFSGTLRTILPLAEADERAGLLSAFYLEGYLAFSLPAVSHRISGAYRWPGLGRGRLRSSRDPDGCRLADRDQSGLWLLCLKSAACRAPANRNRPWVVPINAETIKKSLGIDTFYEQQSSAKHSGRCRVLGRIRASRTRLSIVPYSGIR